MDGGPLKPKEIDSERITFLTSEKVNSVNEGKTDFISNPFSKVYGAMTTLLSQWQLIPARFNCGELESVKVLLTKSTWLANSLCKYFVGVLLKAKIASNTIPKNFLM